VQVTEKAKNSGGKEPVEALKKGRSGMFVK
jgi:hypothetical protein